jgi:hypothetical protein
MDAIRAVTVVIVRVMLAKLTWSAALETYGEVIIGGNGMMVEWSSRVEWRDVAVWGRVRRIGAWVFFGGFICGGKTVNADAWSVLGFFAAAHHLDVISKVSRGDNRRCRVRSGLWVM